MADFKVREFSLLHEAWTANGDDGFNCHLVIVSHTLETEIISFALATEEILFLVVFICYLVRRQDISRTNRCIWMKRTGIYGLLIGTS